MLRRRTGSLVGAAVRLCGCAAVAACASGCASAGDPPGGPPDVSPPAVTATVPDSGAVLAAPPGEVSVVFDEVVNERAQGQRPDIGNALLLSPDTAPARVRWHRNRLTIRPRDGFQPGRIYRVELLPVISDLRNNRLRRGVTIVFSTGPEIPHAVLSGTLVDWPQGRGAVNNGFVEAVLLPDSLPYRALTDSAGDFRLAQVPPGDYLVFGTIEQTPDRRRGAREAFDTVRVTLADSAAVELYAFIHDTTGPRIRQVDVVDSLTIRLTFDRPLDPAAPLDTAGVHLAPESDSTALLGVARVLTPRQADSARTAEAAARAAARAAQDSVRAPRPDTTRPRPPVDTTLRRAPVDTLRPARGAAPPRDSTRAQKMIARRPAPSDQRVVTLLQPLVAGERYLVFVDSARSLSGVAGPARGQLRAPRPSRADSLRADSLRADSLRADSLRADSLRADTARADSAARRP